MKKLVNILSILLALFLSNALLNGAGVWPSWWYAAPSDISKILVSLACTFVVIKLVSRLVNHYYPK